MLDKQCLICYPHNIKIYYYIIIIIEVGRLSMRLKIKKKEKKNQNKNNKRKKKKIKIKDCRQSGIRTTIPCVESKDHIHWTIVSYG